MNKYEVYHNFMKIGPYYAYVCFAHPYQCADCQFEKRVRANRCSFNELSMRLFGRTYLRDWNEVEKIVQTLFEEGV